MSSTIKAAKGIWGGTLTGTDGGLVIYRGHLRLGSRSGPLAGFVGQMISLPVAGPYPARDVTIEDWSHNRQADVYHLLVSEEGRIGITHVRVIDGGKAE